MPLFSIVLDSTPLGLITYETGKSELADRCIAWMKEQIIKHVSIYVPEIADYEVRRELLRLQNYSAIDRLNDLKVTAKYMPITTDVMLIAAQLWSNSRRGGFPTTDPRKIDADVIVAAQALSLGLNRTEYVVATSNVKLLSHFVSATDWPDIK